MQKGTYIISLTKGWVEELFNATKVWRQNIQRPEGGN